MTITVEPERLNEYRSRRKNWKKWGPYLSERQGGTVREDYSPDGSARDSFPPRSCPQPGLSLGGGRNRRHLRPAAVYLLCSGYLERQGSHPERTPGRAM